MSRPGSGSSSGSLGVLDDKLIGDNSLSAATQPTSVTERNGAEMQAHQVDFDESQLSQSRQSNLDLNDLDNDLGLGLNDNSFAFDRFGEADNEPADADSDGLQEIGTAPSAAVGDPLASMRSCRMSTICEQPENEDIGNDMNEFRDTRSPPLPATKQKTKNLPENKNANFGSSFDGPPCSLPPANSEMVAPPKSIAEQSNFGGGNFGFGASSMHESFIDNEERAHNDVYALELPENVDFQPNFTSSRIGAEDFSSVANRSLISKDGSPPTLDASAALKGRSCPLGSWPPNRNDDRPSWGTAVKSPVPHSTSMSRKRLSDKTTTSYIDEWGSDEGEPDVTITSDLSRYDGSRASTVNFFTDSGLGSRAAAANSNSNAQRTSNSPTSSGRETPKSGVQRGEKSIAAAVPPSPPHRTLFSARKKLARKSGNDTSQTASKSPSGQLAERFDQVLGTGQPSASSDSSPDANKENVSDSSGALLAKAINDAHSVLAAVNSDKSRLGQVDCANGSVQKRNRSRSFANRTKDVENTENSSRLGAVSRGRNKHLFTPQCTSSPVQCNVNRRVLAPTANKAESEKTVPDEKPIEKSKPVETENVPPATGNRTFADSYYDEIIGDVSLPSTIHGDRSTRAGLVPNLKRDAIEKNGTPPENVPQTEKVPSENTMENQAPAQNWQPAKITKSASCEAVNTLRQRTNSACSAASSVGSVRVGETQLQTNRTKIFFGCRPLDSHTKQQVTILHKTDIMLSLKAFIQQPQRGFGLPQSDSGTEEQELLMCPGDQIPISVEFHPTACAVYSNSIRLETNSQKYRVRLCGVGGVANLRLNGGERMSSGANKHQHVLKLLPSDASGVRVMNTGLQHAYVKAVVYADRKLVDRKDSVDVSPENFVIAPNGATGLLEVSTMDRRLFDGATRRILIDIVIDDGVRAVAAAARRASSRGTGSVASSKYRACDVTASSDATFTTLRPCDDDQTTMLGCSGMQLASGKDFDPPDVSRDSVTAQFKKPMNITRHRPSNTTNRQNDPHSSATGVPTTPLDNTMDTKWRRMADWRAKLPNSDGLNASCVSTASGHLPAAERNSRLSRLQQMSQHQQQHTFGFAVGEVKFSHTSVGCWDSKTVEYKNEDEFPKKVTFRVTGDGFVLPLTTYNMKPRRKLPLTVEFRPTKLGTHLGTLSYSVAENGENGTCALAGNAVN